MLVLAYVAASVLSTFKYSFIVFGVLQLCNECHTSDFYEISRGWTPGSLLYGWEVRPRAQSPDPLVQAFKYAVDLR